MGKNKRQPPTPTPPPPPPKPAKARRPRDEGDGILTTRQQMAIEALLSQPTITAAAEASGLSRNFFHDQMKDKAFVAAYRAARMESLSQAIHQTQRYAPLAVQTLAKVMADPKVPYSVQVQAASAMLNFGRQVGEAEEAAVQAEQAEAAYTRQTKADGSSVESLVMRARRLNLLDRLPPALRDMAAKLPKETP